MLQNEKFLVGTTYQSVNNFNSSIEVIKRESNEKITILLGGFIQTTVNIQLDNFNNEFFYFGESLYSAMVEHI